MTADELADSKRYLDGLDAASRSRPTAASPAFLHDAEYFGLGLDFDRRLPGLLDAVTLDDVNEPRGHVPHTGSRRDLRGGPPAVSERS